MTSTISSTTSEASTVPALILGWSAQNAARSLKHRLIGGGLAVALIAPDPDAGAMELLYATAAEAYEARDMLTAETVFTLATDEVPEIDMSFTVDDLDLTLQDDRQMWILRVGFQKVTL